MTNLNNLASLCSCTGLFEYSYLETMKTDVLAIRLTLIHLSQIGLHTQPISNFSGVGWYFSFLFFLQILIEPSVSKQWKL